MVDVTLDLPLDFGEDHIPVDARGDVLVTRVEHLDPIAIGDHHCFVDFPGGR